METGDIFLIDSDASYAKVVKFLMQAPTVWQWIWRKIRGTQNKVCFYHAGMVLDEAHIIEQQKRVEIDNIDTILNKPHVFFRKIGLTSEQQNDLKQRALTDIGEGYDVALIFGKTLTWLTGIKWFCRHFEVKEKEICVTRVGWWWWPYENFGIKTWHELTTDIIDDFCSFHKETWKEISRKE